MVNKTVSTLAPEVFVLHDDMFPLYLVRGERNVLIDAAIGARSARLIARIDEVLAGEPLHAVALTHSHYDHTGMISALERRYGCAVWCSPRTAEILANPKSIQFINKLNREFCSMLRESECPEVVPPQTVQALAEGAVQPLAPGRSLQVLATPGHTRCSISFLLQPETILFPGDAAGVLERDGRSKPLFLSSFVQYEASLLKLQGVGAAVLAPPHNTPVRGRRRVEAFLQRALDAARRVRDEIQQALRRGTAVEAVAEEILAREYPNPTVSGPREAYMINLVAMIRVVQREFLQAGE